MAGLQSCLFFYYIRSLYAKPCGQQCRRFIDRNPVRERETRCESVAVPATVSLPGRQVRMPLCILLHRFRLRRTGGWCIGAECVSGPHVALCVCCLFWRGIGDVLYNSQVTDEQNLIMSFSLVRVLYYSRGTGACRIHA